MPDAQSRGVLWNTARDMVRDAELPPAAHLDLIARHLPAETDVSVIEGVLEFARGPLTDTYLDAAGRDRALATLAETARTLLERTPADLGVRVAALRTLIDCATPGEPARELAGWLESDTLPGLPSDPELRWRVLGRLCVLGAAGEDRIEAELRRDPSSTGHESAARCRAALPTAAAKNAAWQAMFDSDDLTNNLVGAVARGFWQPEQRELLAGFTPRWFDAAAAAAGRRGPAIARALVRDGFPEHDSGEPVLRAGEECLARPDLLPAFRRGVVDRLDDLRRAARVRAAHAGRAGS